MGQTTPVVNTILVNLPESISGYTVVNDDQSYTIVINAKMSHERAMKTYQHELRHIYSDDFDSVETADEIEVKRHGGSL